jgi:hypothetical protein
VGGGGMVLAMKKEDGERKNCIDMLKIPPVPANVVNKEATEAENVKWVYNHLVSGSDLDGCPSPGAWLELHLCRMDPGYLLEFMKGPRLKLLTPPKAAADIGNKKVLDGKPTIDLIDKILEIKRKANDRNTKHFRA